MVALERKKSQFSPQKRKSILNFDESPLGPLNLRVLYVCYFCDGNKKEGLVDDEWSFAKRLGEGKGRYHPCLEEDIAVEGRFATTVRVITSVLDPRENKPFTGCTSSPGISENEI